jgi:hypothetical protein
VRYERYGTYKLDRYTWTQIKPFSQDPPIGRFGHTMVYYKKKVYIYGGINELY